MLAEIVPELFMKNLRAIPSRKPFNYLKELKEFSSGAAYIYTEVILPKMQGKEIYTDELNMSAFELDDINTVYNYFKHNIEFKCTDRNALYALYQKIKAAPPLKVSADFL